MNISGFNQITPTDKFGWHQQLLPVYARLFAPFKNRTGMLMEIGTDGGGGLLMFRDYFPTFRICGVDISPTPQAIIENDSIEHHVWDAYTEESLFCFGEVIKWNIVIDDGPHTIGSQEFFVRRYPSLLSDDGIAIVEDIQDPAHIEQLSRAVQPGFFGFAIDLRHIEPKRYDNLIFVVIRQ